MKTKLSLSLVLSAFLFTSSFSVFADNEPSKARIDRQAPHDAINHTDAKGVVTLWKEQQFKMIPGGKMVPLGDPKTSFNIASTNEILSNPDIEGHVLTALASDPATATLFDLGGMLSAGLNVVKGIATAALPIAGNIAKTVLGAGKTLLSNEGVQAAAMGAVATGITAAATGASNIITNVTAPKTPPPEPAS